MYCTHAVVFPEPNCAKVEDVSLPVMAADEIVVDIEYSFISNGTERWCLTDQMRVPGLPPLAFPHVPGYQAAGTVLDVGKQVTDIRPGDRVFSRNCKQPEDFKGSWWGGHVKRHVNNLKDVVKLPDGVSTFEASALLLAQVGYNGAMKPQVQPGDVAVVIGEGLVGQFAGQVLRSRGAYVIMAGLDLYRLEMASKFSADEVFNNSENTLVEFIRERYPDGVSVVVETASSSKIIRMATELLGRYGQLVLNGYYAPNDSLIDWHWLRRKEISVYCPDSRTRDRLKSTLSLIENGDINAGGLISETKNYTEAAQFYQKLLDSSSGFLGLVLKWND